MAVREPDFSQAVAHARERLASELPSWLTYHDLAHTERYVVPAARTLADDLGIAPLDRILLLTAAWYHDIGFVERYDDNEELAMAYTREVLPGFGYSTEHVEVVAHTIRATRADRQPQTLVEEVMCDADLFVLGTGDFPLRERALRDELAAMGAEHDDRSWNELQISFLETHRYFTAAARARNDRGKAANLEAVRRRLSAS